MRLRADASNTWNKTRADVDPPVVGPDHGPSVDVRTEADLDGVVAAIKDELAAGHPVRVSWGPL